MRQRKKPPAIWVSHVMSINRTIPLCFSSLEMPKTGFLAREKKSRVYFLIEDGSSESVPVSEHLSFDPGFERLNPLQSRFILEGLHKKDVNLIAAWPTSAGKTFVAEALIHEMLEKERKVVYACPLKALAEEKIRRLRKLFPGTAMEIFTGDYREVRNRPGRFAGCDVAIVTTELLDSVTRSRKISEIISSRFGAVVLDEAHIIATERGPVAESALMRVSTINPDMRLVLLSATLPNAGDFGKWVASLNGKETFVLESSWRPVEIEWHVVPVKVRTSGGAFYFEKMERLKEEFIRLVTDLSSDGGILAFVWTLGEGRMLLSALEEMGIPAAFHNASLLLEDRLDLERAFDRGEISVLISTTTLAWGRNLNARHVIIFGDSRGPERVPPWDVIQMGGRAGRLGRVSRGDVWWLVVNEDFARDVLEKQPHILSRMDNPREVGFHLLGELRDGHVPVGKIFSWYERSLAFQKLGRKRATEIFNDTIKHLRNYGAIELDINGGSIVVRLRPSGNIARMFYFYPEEIFVWQEAMRLLLEYFGTDFEDILSDPVRAYYLFFANSRMQNIYVNEREKVKLSAALSRIRFSDRLNWKIFGHTLPGRDIVHHFLIAMATEWYEESVRNEKISHRDAYYKVRPFLWDIERAAVALSEIAVLIFGFSRAADAIKRFSPAYMAGVPVEAAKFLEIRGIGPVRAKKLFRMGIRTPVELREAIERGAGEVFRTLPASVVEEFLKTFG